METTDLGSDSDRANLSLYYYLANLQRFRYTEYIVANQLPVRPPGGWNFTEIAQTTTVNRHAGNVTTTQPSAAFSSPRILIARIHVTKIRPFFKATISRKRRKIVRFKTIFLRKRERMESLCETSLEDGREASNLQVRLRFTR